MTVGLTDGDANPMTEVTLCGRGGPRLSWDPDIQAQSQTPAGEGCPLQAAECNLAPPSLPWEFWLKAQLHEASYGVHYFQRTPWASLPLSSSSPYSADPCASSSLREEPTLPEVTRDPVR